MAQNLPSPAPYAQKAATAAESEGGREGIGSPNTARGVKGPSIPLTGGGRDDPSQGKPYANMTTTCARDESGEDGSKVCS